MTTISRSPSMSARSPARAETSSTLTKEQLASIPCPTLRTLAHEGWLNADANGLVDLRQLDDALKRLGVGALPRKALVGGAQKATAEIVAREVGDLAAGKFHLLQLGGSSLDHAGDTQILRGGFRHERLDWLLGYATNGRLGMAELARAQKDAASAEPTVRKDRVLGLAELTALLRLFGTPDASGRKSISVEGVTDLYQNARFPEEWRATLVADQAGRVASTGKTGLLSLLSGVVEMAFRQVGSATGRAQLGIDLATGRDPQVDQSSATGLGLAFCPAGPPAAASKQQSKLAHEGALGSSGGVIAGDVDRGSPTSSLPRFDAAQHWDADSTPPALASFSRLVGALCPDTGARTPTIEAAIVLASLMHDVAYYYGGTMDDRAAADRLFGEQIIAFAALLDPRAAESAKRTATVDVAAVRVGGGFPFREDYSWSYGFAHRDRGYSTLERGEKQKIHAVGQDALRSVVEQIASGRFELSDVLKAKLGRADPDHQRNVKAEVVRLAKALQPRLGSGSGGVPGFG